MKLNNIKIKTKLLAVSLVVSLIPLAIVGIVAYNSSTDSIIDEILNGLELEAHGGIVLIDRVMSERYNNVRAFASAPITRTALQGDSQDAEALNGYVNRLTTTYAEYELMVVVDRNGNVIATNSIDHDGKAIESGRLLGRNLSSEKWFSSTVNGSVTAGKSHVGDFAVNGPVADVFGTEERTLSFAAPVRDADGNILGVFAAFAHHEMVAGIAGYIVEELADRGIQSVNVTLLNRDGLIIYDNKLQEQVFKANLVDINVASAKLAIVPGAEGARMGYHVRRQVDTVDGYHHSHGYGDYPGLGWSMLVRYDASDGLGPVAQLRNIMLAIGLASIILIAVVTSMFSRSISVPIEKIAEKSRRLAQGHLGITTKIEGNDEIGSLGRSFNTMSKDLKDVMNNITDVASQVASASEELSATAAQTASGADSQMEQANNAALMAERMNDTVQDVTSNSANATEAAKEASKAAVHGGDIVQQTIAGMNKVASSVKESAIIIEALGKSSDEIGKIIAVINDIADQTNLLALNAAIEAARAGEQGRGFAVVADEVRQLAQRTTTATTEITSMIQTIQNDTGSAVASMQAGTEEVSKGVGLANDAGESLHQIVDVVGNVNEMISQITVATENQTVATGEICSSVESVADITRNTSVGAKESTLATQGLADLAGQLQSMMQRFKIG